MKMKKNVKKMLLAACVCALAFGVVGGGIAAYNGADIDLYRAGAESVIEGGLLYAHEKGMTANEIYFTMEKNDVPYSQDSSLRYKPTSESAVKLIRGGVTYEIGHTARETIVKYTETGYSFQLWTLADYKPLQEGDILVLGGSFTGGGVTFSIQETTITVENGGLKFSTDKEKVIIEAGQVYAHSNGGSASGFYFKTEEAYGIPYDSAWHLEYYPVTADAVQIVRDGVTYDVGMTNRPVLVKYRETDFYFKAEAWSIGDFAPLQDGDTVILNGLFQNSGNGTIFRITETSVLYQDGVFTFSTSEQKEIIEAGQILAHSNGGSANGFYFTTEGGYEIPYDSGWHLEYYPVTADAVQIIRDGVTYDVGMTNRPVLVKYRETDFYFKAEAWSIGDFAPLQDGDTVIISGLFQNSGNGTIFRITETSILYKDGFFAFSTDKEDSGSIFVYAGNATSHFNGLTETGLYFSMTENEVPYSSGWEVRYKPEKAEAIKLYRDGNTYVVGHADRETIVKYNPTDYFFEGWTLANYKPLLEGDILYLGGAFINVALKTKFIISPTYILIEEGKPVYINDYAEYLYNKLRAAYSEGGYEYENVLALREIMNAAQSGMQATEDIWEMNAIYEETVAQLSELPLNEEAAAELAATKAETKEQISAFVSLDDYDTDERAVIEEMLAHYLTEVDEALSVVQIEGIFKEAKEELDVIQTRTDKREEAIFYGLKGWEVYLEAYDVVSLRDLNLGDEYVFTQKPMATADDYSALDTRYNTLYNSFAPSEENTTGSVVYKFIYNTNFAGGDNNLCLHVKLRGIMYYGYRFTLGWNTTNILKVQRGESDANTQTLFEPDNYVKSLLTPNKDHLMEFGAIDIKDSNRTWVYAKIDNHLIFSAFCDSLPFGNTPRVDVRAEYRSTGDLTTKITFKHVEEGTTEPAKINGGRLQYTEARSDVRAIYGTLDNNQMPYATDKTVGFYPTNENAVQLIRDGQTIAFADINKKMLYKYTEKDYFFALAENNMQVQNGDLIVIEGDFVGFREDTYEKLVLSVKRVEFTYNDGKWVASGLSLEEVKEDALDELQKIKADFHLYDEIDQTALQAAIEAGESKILAAASAGDVQSALQETLATTSVILTSFEKYQQTKTAELNAYKTELLNDYRAEEQAEMAALKEEACALIAKAKTVEEVDEALANGKAAIDGLQTDKELLAEELAYAKQEKKKEIQAAYGDVDFLSATAEEKEKINQEYLAALESVDNATTVEEVAAAAKAFLDNYSAKEEKESGCGSIVAGVSGMITLLAAACVLLKKKEN